MKARTGNPRNSGSEDAGRGVSPLPESFSPATVQWFTESFGAPTAAQSGAWESIAQGAHTLVVAPTGSGKTLAAFLSALDRLFAERDGGEGEAAGSGGAAAGGARERHGTQVVYISPLKALAVDVERNLRAPLAGIARTRESEGLPRREVTVGIRTGDTPPGERAKQRRNPPDILVTTPESFYLLLTSASREGLAAAHTVIIDEVHALAGTKRGAHLALSLERLDALAARSAEDASPGGARAPAAQRIGLSATVADPHAVARFLAGERPVDVVAPPSTKSYDLSVRVPVEDLADLSGTPAPVEAPAGSAGQGSIWPHIERQVVDLIVAHRSTLVFVNSRRLAERLSARINEIHAADTAPETVPEEPARPPAQMMVPSQVTRGAAPDLAMAHHGSVSKERRAEVEHALKTGELPAVVATSSLELGIDMGAVDLVVQVESPGSVASGLQRVGRAGHNVGDTSVAVLFPKHRADLVHSAITVERMLAGAIEKTEPISNPLDVLAQQTIAAASLDELDVEEWFDLVRRSASFSALPRAAFEATLDMLAGKYPSTDFAELRPRLVWDRDAGVLRGRPGAQRLAVTSGGTIADRGMFGVFMVGDKPTRVGELDEEMVYESRIGDVFALGATSWRIEEITHDRVVVSPAPAHSGRLPFWRGDEMGRPIELGRALGAFLRATAEGGDGIEDRLVAAGLDERARENLRRFVAEQAEATGTVPSDTTIVVERFRDEVGDWRVVLHSPFGAGVHRPWAEAIRARLASRHGFDPVPVVHDDGIILRVPDLSPGEVEDALDLDSPLDAFRGGAAGGEPPIGAADVVFESGEAVDVVTAHVSDTALFASKFRECAGRAMLLPRLDPGKRAPLWQQRQKSAQLLDVAKQYPDFPIILEAVRECLQDVYDVPALAAVLDGIASREIRVVEVTTASASPFAAALMFDYVGAFVYESDGPLAERRAAALSLDPSLLGQLLGRIELRELLDPGVLDEVEDRLQHRAEGYRARDGEGIADLLRLLGPLTEAELAERAEEPVRIEEYLAELEQQSRAARVAFAGSEWWVAAEDLGRLRDALGVPPPPGTGAAFLDSGPDPLGELVRRFARTHAPFGASAVALRFGVGASVARGVLDRLTAADQLVSGEFRPAGTGAEWCDPEVLRRIRRRSLAELRAAIEPVEQETLGRFLPAWQGLGRGSAEQGVDGLLAVIEQLDGVPMPLSAWEPLVLAPRVRDFEPSMLDELLASGEVLWCGRGRSGVRDGLVSLHPADSAPLTLPAAELAEARAVLTPAQALVLRVLERGGGLFFRDIVAAVRELAESEAGESGEGGTAPSPLPTEIAVRDALWSLAWAGLARGDTFSPLRAVLSGALPAAGAAGGKPRGTAGSPAHRSTSRGRGGRSARAPRLGRARLGSAALASTPGGGAPGGTIGAGMRTPPVLAGRWSAMPAVEEDPTLRAHAAAELVLARHGVVTRGAVESEGVPGGFAAVYKVLAAMEDSGGPRRGYYIEGLGGSQFADGSTIDRLRAYESTADATTWSRGQDTPEVHLLAATDPANPYGAALPWPDPPAEGGRAARRAGALVVLVDGQLACYLERGGKTMLVFTARDDVAGLAARELARLVREGRVGTLTVASINGDTASSSAWAAPLRAAGFAAVPQGLRLRAGYGPVAGAARSEHA